MSIATSTHAGPQEEAEKSKKTSTPSSREAQNNSVSSEVNVFKKSTRLWVTAGFAIFTGLVGANSAWLAEPERSAVMALGYFPAAVGGAILARVAASKTEGLVRRIWRLFSVAMGVAVLGAVVYAVAFGFNERRFGLVGVPILLAGVSILAWIYGLAVRLFRGSSENLLELTDFATVTFCSCAVLVYGAAFPLIQKNEFSKVHISLLPAFTVVFIFAILYLVTAPSSRPKNPEYAFLAAGCLLFWGTILESASLVAGYQNEYRIFVGLRSAATLVGLGLLSAAPVHAVRLGPGSEARFRGPWQPPRFFLPYWSLLALVILAAAITIDATRSSVIYGFSAFTCATALVVVRQMLTIRENYRLFAQLSEAHARSQALLRELLKGLEEERSRIANSIDAGPVQQLTGLMLRTERASTRETSHPQLLIEALAKHLSAALTELRELSRSLRPKLTVARGLGEAVAIEAREAFAATPVQVELDIDEPHGLTPDQELHLFRIAEEAIDNVRMHAGASKIKVILKEEPASTSHKGRVILEVRDDGKGFVERLVQQRASRYVARTGISSMRERCAILGGDFQLISTPGAGTVVRVAIESAGPVSSIET